MTLRAGDREAPALEIDHGQLPPDLDQRLLRARSSAGDSELRIVIDERLIVERLLGSVDEFT